MLEPIRRPLRRAVAPVRALFVSDASAGVLLILVAAAALVVANSPLAEDYHDLFHDYWWSKDVFYLNNLHKWINDGLMVLFFFVVGLEVKRELIAGQLSSADKRTLPIIAAVAGMAVPALIYVTIAGGDPKLIRGWAIPAATDIAFALGLLALLGSRVPVALKALLLAIAIIDDIGAIAIIALFYTENMNVGALALALVPAAGMLLLNRAGVARTIPYFLLGAFLWVCVLKSGVHATLAGVVTAMFVPIATGDEQPLERLEHALHPWVAFMILPIFAFANAGVSFAGAGLEALFAPLSLGIAAGLVVGKQIGVFGACWLAAKTKLASMPPEVTWRHIYGLSCLAGIGFTMSLFIGGLAFIDPDQIDAVKMGVLVGSLLSAVIGMTVLATAPRAATRPLNEVPSA